MYHLSKELTGVLLQHDTYGSHLDNAGKTVNEDLEKRNFEAAGKTLASIWSNLQIDGFPTVAEYVDEAPAENIKSYVPSAAFRSNHIFETQYMTVYLKCDDVACCSPFVTNVQAFFPHRKIPPLIPIKRSEFGVVALERSENINESKVEFLPLGERIIFQDSLVSVEDKLKYKSIPYDLYFPTLREKIEKRVCSKCSKYHATIKSLNVHKRVCKERGLKRTIATVESESEEDERDPNSNKISLEEPSQDFDEHAQQANIISERPRFSVSNSESFIEQILDLREWLKSPWVADDM